MKNVSICIAIGLIISGVILSLTALLTGVITVKIYATSFFLIAQGTMIILLTAGEKD